SDVCSSDLALRVKVSPRICSGRTYPLATSHTTREAMVSLLPEPAPAMTTAGSKGAETTWDCSAVGSGCRRRRASSAGVNSGWGWGWGWGSDMSALVLDRATGTDGAGPAALITGGGEAGTAHAGGDLAHQLTGPPGLGVLTQGWLGLFPRILDLLTDLHQRCTPGLGQAERGEGTFEHSHLVDPELGVALQILRPHPGGSGLDVDDHGSPLFVTFEAIDPSGDLDTADVDLETFLRDDEFTQILGFPVDQFAHHGVGALTLLVRLPRATEVQVGPDLVHASTDLVGGAALGHEDGDCVQDGPQCGGRVSGGCPGGPLEEPAKLAIGEALHLGGGDTDRVLLTGQGQIIGEGCQGIPLGGIGSAYPFFGQPRQVTCRGVPQRFGGRRVGHDRAQIRHERGQGEPP